MGVVHLALDPRGRAVAIKVLRAHVAHDDDARRRLGREVDTLSRIRDDRVASVIDADVMGPRPYIVTRYVAGPALDEIVEELGPLAPDELLRLARGVAEAIRAIHACGVVHRDIKPGNVLLEDGEPVLIDFGIAHLQDDVRHTVGGLVMGTPGYLSPELVEGAEITDATDWWGWAATITFAASGRPPFGRARMDAVLTRVRAGDVDLDGVDPRLVPLLRASLSPDPAPAPARRRRHRRPRAVCRRAGRHRAAPARWPLGRCDGAPRAATDRLHAGAAGAQHGGVPARASRRSPGRAPRAFEADHSPERWDRNDGHAATTRARLSSRRVRCCPRPAATGTEGGPEDVEEVVPREGDPRIGLPMRTGLLGAAALAWVGALATWPGIALLALLAWSILARATDLSVTALVLRRYERGRRRSDVAMAVVLSPWHLVVGIVATAVSLLLPLGVALAGIFGSALLLAGTRGGDLGPGSPVTLAVGGALGLAMLWWGPGGASLRRGSRSIVRRVVPAGLPLQVVTGVLATFGVVAGAVAIAKGASVTWIPFSGNPFGG